MTQKISPAVFFSAAWMASTMRALSASEIIASPAPRGAATAERAPPPEKPPPPGKPPDQDESDDPHEPGIGMKIGPREPRRGPAPVCAYPRPRLATLRTIMKKMKKKNRRVRTSTRPG